MKQQAIALAERVARAVGYDKTHITRTVAYRTIDAFLDTLPVQEMDALEIAAGWKWRWPATYCSPLKTPVLPIPMPESACYRAGVLAKSYRA